MNGVLIFLLEDGSVEIATRLSLEETRQYAKEKGYVLDEVSLRAPEQGGNPDWKLLDCEVGTGP